MPRRSGFSSRGSSNRQSSARAQPAPQPAPRAQPQPQAQATGQPGFMSGMMGTVMTGMAFGAGSEVAHQAVRGMMGSNSSHGEVQQASEAQPASYQAPKCQMESTNFVECLKTNGNNLSFCQNYYDLLKMCESRP